jgi:hypothetical protein
MNRLRNASEGEWEGGSAHFPEVLIRAGDPCTWTREGYIHGNARRPQGTCEGARAGVYSCTMVRPRQASEEHYSPCAGRKVCNALELRPSTSQTCRSGARHSRSVLLGTKLLLQCLWGRTPTSRPTKHETTCAIARKSVGVRRDRRVRLCGSACASPIPASER